MTRFLLAALLAPGANAAVDASWVDAIPLAPA
jgi:hypothetical protein